MSSGYFTGLSAVLSCSTIMRLKQQRVIRFLLAGGITLVFNMLIIFVMIDLVGLDSAVLRNVANVLSIELSLLFSFFVYRSWVWPGIASSGKAILGREIPLYHVSVGVSATMRILVIFPILDWLGVNYAINTMIGISLGAGINYIFNDRIIFIDRIDL